jgi:hypothetical protein
MQEEGSMIVIQAYAKGLSAVRCANPEVRLSIERDPALADEAVLAVTYPASTGRPAERDVWCDAENRDWSSGSGISLQVKPDQPIRLSVSFMGTNGVAYTAWSNLVGGQWQPIEISFAEIKPNPFFQLPGANKASPLDVSDVKQIGFAPQVNESGRMFVSRLIVVA